MVDIFVPTEFGVMRLDNEGNFVGMLNFRRLEAVRRLFPLVIWMQMASLRIIFRGLSIDAGGNILWEAPDIESSGRRYCSAFVADLDQDGFPRGCYQRHSV